MSQNPAYKRVMLKVSGEALMGDRDYGLDNATCRHIAEDIRGVVDLGVQVCLVIGGGNIFRGISGAASGMDRAQADSIGMLATVMNALAMQNALEKVGVQTRVQSAIPMASLCEPFIRRRAERHMEKGRVIILAAGTGNPFFTTDTCASLRGVELQAQMLLKATKVDGVYTADPKKDPTATKLNEIKFSEAIAKRLAVMDLTALTMCMEHSLPVRVFNFHQSGNVKRAMCGEAIGTLVSN